MWVQYFFFILMDDALKVINYLFFFDLLSEEGFNAFRPEHYYSIKLEILSSNYLIRVNNNIKKTNFAL